MRKNSDIMSSTGANSINEHTAINRFALGVLGLCFTFGFIARGFVESFLVFLLPISTEFEADRASVTSIYSIATLLTGLSSPLAGILFDKLGPRTLYSLGFASLSLGLLISAQADALWQLRLSIGLGLGFGLAALGNVPNAALVNRWFLSKQSIVSSIVFSSFGFGILILVPFAQILIDLLGWRHAYTVLGGGAALLLGAIWLLPWTRIRAGHPKRHDNHPSRGGGARLWTFGQAMKTSAFWGLFAVFFFTSQGMFAITVQAVVYLVEKGYQPIVAASAWGFTGLLMPVGMIAFGWLDDKVGRLPSVTLSYVMSFAALGALWLIGHSANNYLLACFIFFMGCSLGSRGPLVASIALRLFKGPNAGAIFGAITLGGGLGAAIGTSWGGLVHDVTDGYDWVMVLSAASLLLGASPFWTIPSLKLEKTT